MATAARSSITRNLAEQLELTHAMKSDTITNNVTAAHLDAIQRNDAANQALDEARAKLADARGEKATLLRRAGAGVSVTTADLRTASRRLEEVGYAVELAESIAAEATNGREKAELDLLAETAAKLIEAHDAAILAELDAAREADRKVAAAREAVEAWLAARRKRAECHRQASSHDYTMEHQLAKTNQLLAKTHQSEWPRASAALPMPSAPPKRRVELVEEGWGQISVAKGAEATVLGELSPYIGRLTAPKEAA